jgi:two-component system chemotaxis response regulator CheY
MRILIVDDSSATRTFLRETLESSPRGQVEISEADGGLEALRLLPRGPYSLVITDINMSGINGLELLNFIRNHQQHANTPVLLISTQASERDRERGMKLGASAFLAKPFSPEQFRDAVAELVGGAEARG